MVQGGPTNRSRSIQAVDLSNPSAPVNHDSNDLFTSLANLRQVLSKQKPDTDMNSIDPNVPQSIESVLTQIQSLELLTNPTEYCDKLHDVLKIYITDFLPLNNCVQIICDDYFQQILSSVMTMEQSIDFNEIFTSNPDYARTVFFRLFDLLSLPSMIDVVKNQCNDKLMPHASFVFRFVLSRIQTVANEITFKKNDLQNHESFLRLCLEYVNTNWSSNDANIQLTVASIVMFVWVLVDNTILVPNFVNVNCPKFVLDLIAIERIPFTTQRSCISIIHNLARHEQGAKTLREANGILIIKDFKRRVLDTNDDNNNVCEEMRLLYSMVLSLLMEPKENKDDLKNLRKVLDQLMQLAILAGQTKNHKYGGFHVSEPIVVLTKLCVHDEILNYVLKEANVTNMQASSNIQFFCELVMQFRGALASDDELDQLTLTALFNIIWSISFHDDYVEELKSNAKFLITVKSLANDDGEAWVDQYVPQHMSSIPKAANGILWNLDENNPGKAIRTSANTTDAEPVQKSSLPSSVSSTQIKVMVSYSHADSEFCHQLVDALQKDKRFELWVDFAYCHTEDLWEEIGEAIEKATIVLFVMTKDYQDSKSCRQEVMYTKDSLKKRFIPIYVKKDFIATGWLGVRIVGPQYIRFGKKSFEDTIKELSKLIVEDTDKKDTESKKPTVPPPAETKPNESQQSSNGPKKPEKEIEKDDTISVPLPHENIPISNPKPVRQWTSKDIAQWFDENKIQRELKDMYDFRHGTDLLLYGQCLRPDWQIEYHDMRDRYSKKYNSVLYRDQFVRLVSAIHRLEQSDSPLKSKTCIIS